MDVVEFPGAYFLLPGERDAGLTPKGGAVCGIGWTCIPHADTQRSTSYLSDVAL